jgi:hypothetical protein
MTDREKKYFDYRRKLLPLQLDRARRRYIGLVREAKRMKMYSLLTNREMNDELEDL